MKPFVIKNEAQYEEALAYVSKLMDAAPGSEEESELDLWATLVELYEKEVHPIPLPDPIEAIKFHMERAGLTRKDMIPFLGSLSKVSEVLSGKRPLSLPMMRRLHEGLGISAEVLLNKPGAELPHLPRHPRRPPPSRSPKLPSVLAPGKQPRGPQRIRERRQVTRSAAMTGDSSPFSVSDELREARRNVATVFDVRRGTTLLETRPQRLEAGGRSRHAEN